MRTQINSLTAWLRQHKDDVPDSMIESVEFNAAAPKLTLSFPSEEGLASFGQRVLSDANVTKYDNRTQMNAQYAFIYHATLTWRKRPLNVFLVVKKIAAQPAEAVFHRD